MSHKNTHNLLIAEIGSVHDGSFGNAIKLIHLAKNCGANAVKFQYHISEAETTINAPSPNYFQNETRWNYFKRISFSTDQWKILYNEARKLNLKFIVSPFSNDASINLKKTGIDIFKIASGEITNLPMLEKISKFKKPVIISTGMSTWQEITDAIKIFKKNISDLTVMQCSSKYPCAEEDVGLNIINEIKKKYNCKVGFSDHTIGYAASISAAALGAECIEKHLTFHNDMYGSDSLNAMEPHQFKILSKEIYSTWKMISNPVNKDNISKYKSMRNIFQKSIFLKNNININNKITFEDLDFKKPGNGISANKYRDVINKRAKKNLFKNHMLKKADFK